MAENKKEKKVLTNSEEIKAEVNLADFIKNFIELKPQKDNFVGKSPFSIETIENNFVVYPSNKFDEYYEWKDISNKNNIKGGNVFDFLRYIKNDYQSHENEIIKEVARIANLKYEPPKIIKNDQETQKMLRILKDYQEITVDNLRNNLKICKENLYDRNVSNEMIKRQGLGYGEFNDLKKLEKKGYSNIDFEKVKLINKQGNSFFGKRIMIPIKDENGNIVAFGGRAIKDSNQSIKYLNSINNEKIFLRSANIYAPETNYEMAQKMPDKKDTVIICEGFFDAIALAEAGFNAKAGLGTEITDIQASKMIKGMKNAIVMLDGDEAGKNHTATLGLQLEAMGINTILATLPEGKDPADFLNNKNQEENANKINDFLENKGEFEGQKNTKTVFEELLENAIPDPNPIRNNRNIIKAIAPLFKVKDELSRQNIIEKLTEITKLPFQTVKEGCYEEITRKVKSKSTSEPLTENISTKEQNSNTIKYNKNDNITKIEEELVRKGINENFLKEITSKITNPFLKEISQKIQTNIENKLNPDTGLNFQEKEFLNKQKNFKSNNTKEDLVLDLQIAILQKTIEKSKKNIENAKKELKTLNQTNTFQQ